jgi:cytoskeletal protein RodZ
MTHFGDELRKQRELRGISIGDIAEVTKVSSRYLTSLEDEHFDALPGGVLNKGIVRNYARAIGLDESIWTDRFMQAYRESGQMKDDDLNWVEFAENVSRSRRRNPGHSIFRLRWAGVFMLLAVLCASGWLVWNYVNSKVDAASPATQTTKSATAQLTQPPSNGS